MKVRSGFVSNSSSSSFCVFGLAFENVDDIALALNITGEPEPVNGCRHEFDRAVAHYCPQCGKGAFKEVDNYDWFRGQVEKTLQEHGLEFHEYDEAGITLEIILAEPAKHLLKV